MSSPIEPVSQPTNGALVGSKGERYLPVPLTPGNGSTDGAPAGTSIGATALVSALRRRWVLGLGLGILAMAAVNTTLYFTFPVRQTIATNLYMKSERQHILFADNQNLSPVSGIFQRTQMALAKSRLVLNTALRKAEVSQLSIIREQKDPIQWLEANIKTDFNLSPELMRISIQGDNTPELLVIINAVRDAYLAEVVEKENLARSAKLASLKKAYFDLDEQLKDKRQDFRSKAEAVGSREAQINVSIHQALVDSLNLQRKELGAMQSELRRLKVDLALAPKKELAANETLIPEGAIEDHFKTELGILRIRNDISLQENHIESIKVTLVNPDDPILIPHKDRLAKLLKAETEYKQTHRKKIIERIREKLRSDAQQATIAMQQRYEGLTKQVAELQTEVQRLQKEAEKMNKNNLDLESLRSELQQKETVAASAMAQMTRMEVEAESPSRILGMEDAQASSADGEKRKLLLMVAMAGLAFAGTFCGVVVWEAQHKRISTADEVKQGIGMTLMGTLPAFRRHRQDAGVLVENPIQEMMNNAVDAARTVLLRAAAADQIRTVMITSAASGEGKTSLSCHLAASLARSGRKVLLIDSDLRNPSLHALFGLPDGPGLCEVLRGEVPIQEALRPTPLPNLMVITAGACDDMALQALSRDAAREVFATLKGGYEFVLVDSAPVLSVADSLMVGQYVDAVLFSILRDVSRTPTVIAAYERLSMLGIRILGAIVNGVRGHDTEGYGYSYEARRTPQEASAN